MGKINHEGNIMMTSVELANARKLLTLEQIDCAELIADVKVLSWKRWEKGSYSIPDDVKTKMYELLNARNTILKNAEDLINGKIKELGENFKMSVIIYTNHNDFKGNKIELGVTNSVAIALYGKYYKHVKLIPFNAESFEKWCFENNKEDSQETRAEWATSQ